MTIRDLLTLNVARLDDYITIRKNGETILKLIEISKLHPIWLNYEVNCYYLLPHKEDECISNYKCDYLITIEGIKFFQDKTNLDKELERNLQHESTNND